MNNSLFVVAGILILGILGAGYIVFLQPPSMDGITMPILGDKPYVEIAGPAGFVNSEPITIGQFIGKEVVLVDFLTYSCINCQRTFPYMRAWQEKYGDQGLQIIGIHTPEFAFEKDYDNVKKAMQDFGITYPIVLDNDYATWRAYSNNYWPRKYLIDIRGNIVYDHIGEGGYEETEKKIRELLAERAGVLGEAKPSDATVVASGIESEARGLRSPELYFGALRNRDIGNGVPGLTQENEFSLPLTLRANKSYLKGKWSITAEYAQLSAEGSVTYRFRAKEVYLVAEADTNTEVEIFLDGELVGNAGGSDVQDSIVTIGESRLYKIIHLESSGEHVLEIRPKKVASVYIRSRSAKGLCR